MYVEYSEKNIYFWGNENASARRIGLEIILARVGVPRSLRVAFGLATYAPQHRSGSLVTFSPHDLVNRQLVHATFVVARSQHVHHSKFTCSLRIAFEGRVVRVGSPCFPRTAFGGRIARVGAPRL